MSRPAADWQITGPTMAKRFERGRFPATRTIPLDCPRAKGSAAAVSRTDQKLQSVCFAEPLARFSAKPQTVSGITLSRVIRVLSRAAVGQLSLSAFSPSLAGGGVFFSLLPPLGES